MRSMLVCRKLREISTRLIAPTPHELAEGNKEFKRNFGGRDAQIQHKPVPRKPT